MAQGDIAWILGAGFSRPLGGPLLNGLFAPNAVLQMRDRFPKAIYRAPSVDDEPDRLYVDAAVWLYNYGRAFEQGRVAGFDLPRRGDGERLWDDAEEFLDVLDLAATPAEGPEFPSDADYKAHPMARLLDRFFSDPDGPQRFPSTWEPVEKSAGEDVRSFLGRVNIAARQLMAAQCSAFMLTADIDTERWDPFAKWARQLLPRDTVITFNYDCAVERVAGPERVQVVVDEATAKSEGKARLFKMHGSTDWLRRITEQDIKRVSQWSCLHRSDEAFLCIGTPGPNKRRFVAGLRAVWDGALKAIQEAEAVIFVGYRFPPSDSDARESILSAIEINTSPWLLLHTVLGPRVNDDDTSRLRGLLSARMQKRKRLRAVDTSDTKAMARDTKQRRGRDRHFGVVSHPLYSQDFVSMPGDPFHPHHAAGW